MIYLYSILFLWIILFEFLRKKKAFIDFLSVFHLFFLPSYVLAPLFFLSNPEKYFKWKFLSVEREAPNSWLIFLIILISYVLVVIGFITGNKLSILKRISIWSKFSEKINFNSFLLLLIVFIGLAFIYSLGFGGPMKLISSGQEIRSGSISGGIYGYFRYFSMGILLMPIFFFSAFLYSKNRVIRKKLFIVFVISFLLALIYGLGTGGRANTGMTVILVFLIWLNFDGTKFTFRKILYFASIFCFFIYLVVFGRSTIVALATIGTDYSYFDVFIAHYNQYQKQSTETFIDKIIVVMKYFDHHIASLYPAIYKGEVFESPRLFLDYPRAVLSIVPGITRPDFIVSSMPAELNKLYYSYNMKNIGYVPLGWIGLKIINGGVFWLALDAIIAGILAGILNSTILRNLSKSIFMPAIFIYAIFYWHEYILGTEGTEFVFGHFSDLFFLFILVTLFKVSVQKPYAQRI